MRTSLAASTILPIELEYFGFELFDAHESICNYRSNTAPARIV